MIKESTIHSMEQPSQWPTLDTPTFIGLGGGRGGEDDVDIINRLSRIQIVITVRLGKP